MHKMSYKVGLWHMIKLPFKCLSQSISLMQHRAVTERVAFWSQLFCMYLYDSSSLGEFLLISSTILFAFRLICEQTVEENILKKANEKRILGDIAIEGGNFNTAFFKKVVNSFGVLSAGAFENIFDFTLQVSSC